MRSDKHDLQLRHYFHVKHISLFLSLSLSPSCTRIYIQWSGLRNNEQLVHVTRKNNKRLPDRCLEPSALTSISSSNEQESNKRKPRRRTPSFLLSKFSKNLVSRMFSSLLFHSRPPSLFLLPRPQQQSYSSIPNGLPPQTAGKPRVHFTLQKKLHNLASKRPREECNANLKVEISLRFGYVAVGCHRPQNSVSVPAPNRPKLLEIGHQNRWWERRKMENVVTLLVPRDAVRKPDRFERQCDIDEMRGLREGKGKGKERKGWGFSGKGREGKGRKRKAKGPGYYPPGACDNPRSRLLTAGYIYGPMESPRLSPGISLSTSEFTNSSPPINGRAAGRALIETTHPA